MEFSRCTRDELALHRDAGRISRSLKTQQRTEYNVEVDVLLGELNSRTESKLPIDGFSAYRNVVPDSLERR